MAYFGIVENLAIEDYITSHALKNCLLNLLKRLFERKLPKPERTSYSDSDLLHESIADTHCKYAIASYIIDEFRSNLVAKKMTTWLESGNLLSCMRDLCGGEANICCRKLKIKLALIEKMSAWLKNEDHLRYFHDGDACNCSAKYSQSQLSYHKKFIMQLVKGGNILFADSKRGDEGAACEYLPNRHKKQNSVALHNKTPPIQRSTCGEVIMLDILAQI